VTHPVPAPPTEHEPDPLVQVEAALAALPTVALDDHPEVFARVDGLLRTALDGGGAPARA
jgi:hypothetical protein